MTLLQLAYFVEVCKCRNMTKAAANLHISQPAITKAIQELESEYGARLLLRRKNGQELTGEGQFLYQRAEALLRQAEEHARGKGYRNLKYVIGSTGMSCHGRPLGDYAKELAELRSLRREHYDFFYGYGFRPAGFIPNCYGEDYHGIIMIKGL